MKVILDTATNKLVPKANGIHVLQFDECNARIEQIANKCVTSLNQKYGDGATDRFVLVSHMAWLRTQRMSRRDYKATMRTIHNDVNDGLTVDEKKQYTVTREEILSCPALRDKIMWEGKKCSGMRHSGRRKTQTLN